jgi:hypothetical protein
MILDLSPAIKFVLSQFLFKNLEYYDKLYLIIRNRCSIRNDDLSYECFIDYLKNIKISYRITTSSNIINTAIKNFSLNINLDEFILDIKNFLNNLSENNHCVCIKHTNSIEFNMIHFNHYFYPGRIFNDENMVYKFNNFLIKNNLHLHNGVIKFNPAYNKKEKIFNRNHINELLNINLENNVKPLFVIKIETPYDFFLKYDYSESYDAVFSKKFEKFILWILEFKYENIQNNYELSSKRFLIGDAFHQHRSLYFIHKNKNSSPFEILRRLTGIISLKIIN